MLKTLTITALFMIAFVMEQASSHTKTCIGESCFATPGSNEMKNFDDAKSWCIAHNSTLAVVNNTETQMALTEFLNSSNIGALAYINIKLYQHGNTWFLANGSTFTGSVGNQDNITYRLYCRLVNDTKADFTIQASNPSDLNNYICYFEDSKCFSNTTNYFIFDTRCYVKYENEKLTWYQARERCIKNGGDLAKFNYKSGDRWIVPFNKSDLNTSSTYWVGIRWNDWSWKFPDNGNEVIYSSWAQDRPNNYNYSCVCVDPDGRPVWSWTDCNCTVERPFVCLQIVPTTTVITTTPTTTTAATSVNTANNDSTALGDQKQLSKSQIIGLGAGIGGGFSILLIVVIIIVAVVILRRKRKSNESSESRLAVESNGENNDEIQPNKVAESDGKDLYSQVHKPPRNQVNNSRGNDVYAQVNKHPQNQVNNDVYAKVVSDGKQQMDKTESSPEIIYSAPEFAQDPKSTPSNSNYEVA